MMRSARDQQEQVMAKSQAAQQMAPHMAPHMAASADDDIPRTFRREREARDREAREAREREAAARGPDLAGPAPAPAPAGGHAYGAPYDQQHEAARMPPAAQQDGVVTALDIPFFGLMRFLIKAVLAGIPALILLMAILWLFGQGVKIVAPQLLKAKIEITFPN